VDILINRLFTINSNLKYYEQNKIPTYIEFKTIFGNSFSYSHKDLCKLNDIKQNGIKDNIIVGDFNCGPNVSINNYNKFHEAGFLSLDSEINTWDPKNPLNINGIHKDCPEQSIDHILINSKFSLKSESSSLKVIFKDANIITQKMAVTLSDHYGISLEL
jgi:endonuclease/exonuclease/phosphatase family metal-dependent hydrolase